MTDLNKQELRRLAESASPAIEWYVPGDLRYADDKTGEVHGLNHDDDSFISAANPAAILSLLDEMEGKCAEIEELDVLCGRQSDLLSQAAVALRGPEPALTRYSHADIPSRVKEVVDERDQLRAEVESLRKDAERYRDALAHVAAQVDGNIREAVRDCVNFIGDVQDIYGYCDQIDEIIDTAIDPDLAKEGGANG